MSAAGARRLPPIRKIPRWVLRDLASFAVAGILVALALAFGEPPAQGGLFAFALPVELPAPAAPSTRNILFIALFGAAYLVSGWNVLSGAARHIRHGQVFDELFLMSLATIGAFAIGEFEEALGVMVFYKIGEMLQEGAQARSRASIRALLDLRPDTVRVRAADGSGWRDIDPALVQVGAEFRVLPGERLGLDGVIVSGESALDTSAITGEPKPRAGSAGGEVMAGFIALDGALVVRSTKPSSESQISRIMAMVEDASTRKARIEGLVTRWAPAYTRFVVFAAAAIAFLPPLLLPGQALSVWLYRALVMLVISCPCALVVSVPLGYFGGLGGAARRGILLKGSSVMDALARAGTVVFDKTGTLTDGRYRVRSLHPEHPATGHDLVAAAAAVESGSRHPLAAAVIAAHDEFHEFHAGDSRACIEGDTAGAPSAAHGREYAGEGVTLGGPGGNGPVRIAAGNHKLMRRLGIALPDHARAGAGATGSGASGSGASGELFVARDGAYLGSIRVGDALKPDSADSVRSLRGLGVARVVMLSGDAEAPARAAAAEAGVDEVHASLLPEDKLRILEEIMRGAEPGRTTLFVGDGINDAPVLARADAGIAMGSGADAAVETADAVILTGEPSRVAEAIARSRGTRRIVLQNVAFALSFKAVVLGLGAAGIAGMWSAVVADVGVALLATANSLRAMR